jgi:hypothetical protein
LLKNNNKNFIKYFNKYIVSNSSDIAHKSIT